MYQTNLSIFMKETDATAVGLGFYYQYEATLNSWLKNYISKSQIQIFCETEDDIKEINLDSNEMKFSQVKCYSNEFSLKSEAIKKTICNFYMLNKKYQNNNVTFEFVTNTEIKRSEKVLLEWVDNRNQLTKGTENLIIIEIKKILEDYFLEFTEKKKKNIDKKIKTLKKAQGKNQERIDKLLGEKNNVESLFQIALVEISYNGNIKKFIDLIKWSFNNESPEVLVKKLIEENKSLISEIENSSEALDLIHARLFSEIHVKSSNKDIEERMVDNNLLEQILEESANEMMKKTDKGINIKLTELNSRFFKLEKDVRDLKEAHLDENYINIKKQFKLYGEKKVLEFSEHMKDENFSIYDIYVEPEFYSFPFRGELQFKEIKENEEDREEGEVEDQSRNVLGRNVLGYLRKRLKLKDNLILIHGDPGIGKSSLSKVMFKTFFEEEKFLPFHLELKTINYTQDFRNTIYNELTENIKNFANYHLTDLKILLILDGFDELHLLTEGSLISFFDNLVSFVGKYKNIKVILTGRTTAFSEMSDLIPRRTEIIILKKFDEYHVREWLYNWLEYNKTIPEKFINELVEYNNYQDSILGFPLILYLFCKMLEEDNALSPKEMFDLEKWEFYEKLIDWTCATSKFVEQNDFNPLRKDFNMDELSIIKRELNQNIALAMYHKKEFSVTQKDIVNKELLPQNYLIKKKKVSIDDNDYKIINTFIVLNYMRPTEKKQTSDVAFEFVHKSFYEFLASESLINTLLKLNHTEIELLDIAEHFYKNFGGFKLNEEMAVFLKPLLENKSSNEVNVIYGNLKRLYTDFILQHSFINNHDISMLNTYFKRYPENSFNKIEIQTNVIFNMFFLLSFLSGLFDELYEICNDKDRKLKNLLFPANNLEISSLSLNNFYIKDTSFIGDNFENVDISASKLQNVIFKSLDLNNIDFNSSELLSVKIDGCEGFFSDYEDAKIYLSEFKNSNLKTANFSTSDIQSVNFYNSMLEGSLFEKSTLTNCKFEYVSLENVDFYNTEINNTEFINCGFQNSTFSDSHVKNSIFKSADFSESNLKNADFSGTDLSGAIFMNTNLEGVNFSNANLSNVILKGANINGANFSAANLSGVDFSYIDLHDDKIPKCELNGANLTDCNLSVMNLTNLALKNTNLTGANLGYSNLENCDLSNAFLLNTNLSSAILINADLSNSKIISSNLDDSYLAYCNFNLSNISSSSLVSADFFHAVLEGVNISNSNFESAELFSVNINEADIRDSNFKQAKMEMKNGNLAVLINNAYLKY